MSIKLQGSSHILEQLAKTKQTPWFFQREVVFVCLTELIIIIIIIIILREKKVKLGGQ